MSQNTFHTQVPYSAILESLVSLPQEITGDNVVTRRMLEKCANTLLGLIRDSFIVKSLGGTDDAGDRWAPLKKVTIENRANKRKGRVSSFSKKRKGESSKVYDSSVRRARSIMKSKGRTPTHNKYARRDNAILHDSGALLESLTPHSSSRYQVLEVGNGTFAVGTTREGAYAHHRGVPGKLPQRRLWPSPNNFPDKWWDMILKDIQGGMVETIKEIIRGAM